MMLLRDLLFSFSVSMLAAQAGAAPAPVALPAAAPVKPERTSLPARLIAAQQEKAPASAATDQDGLPVVLLGLALLLIRGRGQRSSAAPWQAIPVEQDMAALAAPQPAAPQPAAPRPAATSSTTCRPPSSRSASTMPGCGQPSTVKPA